MRHVSLLVAVVAHLLAADVLSAPRSSAARAQFQRQAPCPGTGAARGPCKGYVVDHVVPLCAGGADRPANMQWQTVADAKAKDRLEVRQCRGR